MYLVYLSEENLSNTNFIKELVYNFKLSGPSLILHEAFGSEQDTRFVTKRLSSLLSESMVFNTALSGDQRDLLCKSGDLVQLRAGLIHKMLKMAPVFVMNCLAKEGEETVMADPLQVLSVARNEMKLKDVFMFPRNSRSPLVKEKVQIAGQSDTERLLSLYEEESKVLNRAQLMAPVTLASPLNFAK